MLPFPNVFYCLLLDFIKSDPPAVLWDADGFCYEKSFTHLLAIPKRELAYCISVFLIYTFLFAIIPLNDKFCDFLIPL